MSVPPHHYRGDTHLTSDLQWLKPSAKRAPELPLGWCGHLLLNGTFVMSAQRDYSVYWVPCSGLGVPRVELVEEFPSLKLSIKG